MLMRHSSSNLEGRLFTLKPAWHEHFMQLSSHSQRHHHLFRGLWSFKYCFRTNSPCLHQLQQHQSDMKIGFGETAKTTFCEIITSRFDCLGFCNQFITELEFSITSSVIIALVHTSLQSPPAPSNSNRHAQNITFLRVISTRTLFTSLLYHVSIRRLRINKWIQVIL